MQVSQTKRNKRWLTKQNTKINAYQSTKIKKKKKTLAPVKTLKVNGMHIGELQWSRLSLY